jgi:Zn-dependent protease with chaperone function
LLRTAALALPLMMIAIPAVSSPQAARQTSTGPEAANAPARITDYTLPPPLLAKAKRLSRIRVTTRVFSVLYAIFVLWLVLRRRWAVRYRDLAERAARRHVLQALIFTSLLLLAIDALHLPVAIFQESVLKRYGISVQSWPSWAGDWVKASILQIVIASFLAAAFYAIARRSSRRWWLYAWLGSLPLIILGVVISPLVIDPLFNKYEPLSRHAPQLVESLQRILHRAGQDISPDRMFWMKASDKTIATNAYVAGIGPSKRIVIWDTTLAEETPDEVLTDFGHELGHYVLHHIWKGMAFAAFMTLLGLVLLYLLIPPLLARFGPRWGIRGNDDWASMPALLLVIAIFTVPGNAAANTYSRYLESQADLYSIEVTHGVVPDAGQAAAHSYQKFGELVFADPDPDPLYVFTFYDHPTLKDRIRFFTTYDPWSKGQTTGLVK